MRTLRYLPLLAALVAASACDRAPTAAEPTAGASFDHAVTVTISAPDEVYVATDVTATASWTPSGSWYTTWYYRWCYDGSAPGDCDYVWHKVTEGQDVMSITKRVYEQDFWVDFRIVVTDIYGHVIGSDDHRVWGPRTFSGGCTDGMC